jgi:hypothetical protein
MELAELDGKIWKAAFQHCNDSSASVDDEASERMSCGEQCVEGFFVVHNLLGDDFLPVEVPAVGAADKNAVAASEECRIHGNDDGIRLDLHLACRSGVGIKILSQCLRMLAVLSAQFCIRLLVCRVLVVGLCDPGILLESFLLKLLPAIAAFVALTAPALTVFLCAVKSSTDSAEWAFLKLEKDKSMISVLL